jgi:hypothetical protein
MERRTVLKNIGLSFGAITLTPTVASLIQSCQSGETVAASFLNTQQAGLVGKIIDVILPTTANVPGALDLNLLQFIDGYIDKVSSKEEQDFVRMAVDTFGEYAKNKASKKSVGELTNEDIDVQLNQFLRASSEVQDTRSNSYNLYEEELLAGNTPSIPVDGVCHEFLKAIHKLVIFAFQGNEIIAKEHMVYVPVPGQQKGCVDLEEATGGKAWAL